MKCPKCAYIGFEPTDRCKNCGYEFALATSTPVPAELPMTADADADGPLRDLALKPGAERPRRTAKPLDLDRMIGAEPDNDLPLFAAGAVDEDLPPLVAPRATPRRPLAVRRPTPDPSRLRPRPRDDARERASAPTLPLPERAATAATPAAATHTPDVSAGARLGAALIDLGLVAGIDAITFYFTLRLCGLTTAEWRVLPVLPLASFFLIINGGYLAAFTTAGGQTIGKMAFGLKVVAHGNGPVPLGLAAVRALGCIASTLCLGLGLLPALVGGGGLALHDRLADTRVVRLRA